jgi:hypothetical protein
MQELPAPADLSCIRSPGSEGATLARCSRRTRFSAVLLVAVKTAVTRWQPGALGKDQGGSPGDDPSDAEVPVWSVFRGERWRLRIARSTGRLFSHGALVRLGQVRVCRVS